MLNRSFILKRSIYLGMMILFTSNVLHGEEAETSPIPSNSLKQDVIFAIKQFKNTVRGDWSYRIERYENEEGEVTSSTEIFNPSLPDEVKWDLEKLNGNDPTTKQINKFRKTKNKREEEKQHNVSIDLEELIQVDSLQSLSEDNKLIKANFNVFLSRLGKEASAKLQGELTLNKSEKFIENIRIYNLSTFSPMFSAKITDFNLSLHFTKINHSILPIEQNMKMKGTFAYFTEIDEVSTDTFSDYYYHGE